VLDEKVQGHRVGFDLSTGVQEHDTTQTTQRHSPTEPKETEIYNCCRARRSFGERRRVQSGCAQLATEDALELIFVCFFCTLASEHIATSCFLPFWVRALALLCVGDGGLQAIMADRKFDVDEFVKSAGTFKDALLAGKVPCVRVCLCSTINST
jgi:hypothetical protein